MTTRSGQRLGSSCSVPGTVSRALLPVLVNAEQPPIRRGHSYPTAPGKELWVVRAAEPESKSRFPDARV